MSDELYPAKPILLVDDEAAWLRSLSMTLRESAGMNNFIKCSESREVLHILHVTEVSIILLDLTMPDLPGQELLPMITKEHPEIPVIVLSGMNQIDTAVRCIQAGAFDYFVKTVEKERLISGIQRAFLMQEMHNENQRLKSRFLEDHLEHPEAFAHLHTRSKKMRTVLQYCEAVAQSPEPILITGESGVGKELIARAIHAIHAPSGPWVAVNVAGLDDNVFSDTLFGHTRGAFTGADRERRGMIEEAAGGTLFLDEIGDLSLASQVKLLRLLQEGEYFPLGSDSPRRVRSRLIFATNCQLSCQAVSGSFRKDLFYRISAHQIRIPSLRERIDDLPLLIHRFLQEAAESFGKKIPIVPKELIDLLSLHSFPGNVRELRAMIFNAVSLQKTPVLSLEPFREKICPVPEVGTESIRASDESMEYRGDSGSQLLFPEKLPNLEEVGNQLVAEAMRRAQGNQTLAAAMLGITRQGLAKRLKKSGPRRTV